MTSEEEIKRKMLAKRMQEQQMAQYQSMQENAQIQEQMHALKMIMNQILEPKARDRLNNLKTVKPEAALQLEMYLAQLAQSGQIKSQITDDQIVMILRKITEKKETKITRK